MRWVVVLVFVLFAGRADAQVFKPRTQNKTPPAKTTKTPAAAPRKSARPTGTARKSTSSSKSRAARGKGRPSDLTPDPKKSDEDVVIITDEDEDD